jgi:hypothetical protein
MTVPLERSVIHSFIHATPQKRFSSTANCGHVSTSRTKQKEKIEELRLYHIRLVTFQHNQQPITF